MNRSVLCLALALVVGLGSPALAEPAISVIDGDGLRVEGQNIRLWGIDAPELAQTCRAGGRETPCGKDARFLLGALIKAGPLSCAVRDTDRYGRPVARCMAGGHDLGAEMVRQGYALDYKRYSDGFYDAQEQEARRNKRGLWAGEFTAPWEWRKHN